MKDAELRLGDPEQVLATSGESFFWARRFLGPTIGHNAARLYSFCRVLDDMADGDIPNGPAHLEVIQSDLNGGCGTTIQSSTSSGIWLKTTPCQPM